MNGDLDLNDLFKTPTKLIRECLYCKKIFGIYAEGKYSELCPNEEYNPDWPISHGICPACEKKLEEET